VKRADELMDAEFLARWMDREAIGEAARCVLRAIHEHLVADGGPLDPRTLDVAALDARTLDLRTLGDRALHLHPPDCAVAAERAVAELDEKDLVVVQDGHVVAAYPFATRPTGFVVVLDDGRERHACCAIDALGVPAMLRRTCRVRARCHHCGEPMELRVSPDGPLDHPEAMAWVGRREDVRVNASASL
jgi:hypothetical protein